MRIAFFDFDGTLIKHDSFISFAKCCVGGHRFMRAIFRAAPALILWKLGLKSNSSAKQALFSCLYKGMSYSSFKKSCREFAQYINGDLRAEIIAQLRAHLSNGDRVFIVSASIADWIRPWAESIGVDSVIATEIEVDEDGMLTGAFSTPNCHGNEKAERIKSAIPDLENYETWAYGNSAGDDAMLRMVNHPHRL